MREPVSCVAPNFNGEKLLPVFLDRLAAALIPGDEVIIVDDCSRDSSIALIEQRLPSARIVRLPRNEGFAAAVNAGMRAASRRLTCVLNTDVEVEPGFLDPLCRQFLSDGVFTAAATEVTERPVWALPCGEMRCGLFYYRYAPFAGPLQAAVPVLFASGTCALYDREKFLALGGFDPLFRPFYFEDLDLCLRAWMRGWRSVYEPESRFLHKGQATIGAAFPRRTIKAVHWKNRFLFTWKNIRDPLLFAQHLALLPLWVLLSPLAGRPEITGGFFRALPQLAEALKARARRDPEITVSERVIFAKVRDGVCAHRPASDLTGGRNILDRCGDDELLKQEACDLFYNFSNRSAVSYSKKYETWKRSKNIIRVFLAELGRRKWRARVGDFGCSLGRHLFLLNSLLPEGASVTFRGFDINPGAITTARKLAAVVGTGNIGFERRDALASGLAGGEFDIILCGEVIEHVAAPGQFAAEMRRLLAPGGMLIVTTPNRTNGALALKTMARASSGKRDGEDVYGHISVKGRGEWIRIFTAAGLRVEQARRGSLLCGGETLDRRPVLFGVVLALEALLDLLPFTGNMTENVTFVLRKD